MALAAQQYYVEYGSDMNTERLVSLVVHNYIPDPCLQGYGMKEKYVQMIVNEHRKVTGCCYTKSYFVWLLLGSFCAQLC